MTDGRLLLPAGAAWLGAAVATWGLSGPALLVERHELAAPAAVAAAGVAALGAVLVALALRAGSRAVLTMVLLAAVLCSLGVLTGALGVMRLTADPMAAWVDARATAVVTGTVSGEARVRPAAAGWRQQTTVEIPVHTESVAARDGEVGLRIPVLVRLPEGTQPPVPGTRVEFTGRLSPLPPRTGYAASVSARRSADGSILAVVAPPGGLDRAAQAMRGGLRRSLAAVDPEAGALVAGLAVGDDSGQPAELTRAMRESGLSHLTAVSGGNVAIVLGVVLGLAALVRLSLLLRVGLGLAALGYFVLLVGPEASVLRASVMGAVAVIGVLVGGRRGGPSVLATGILLLLAVRPWLALSWGFALSAFAAGGLILVAPGLRARLGRWRPTRRWPPAVLEGASLTIAAQLATLPLLVAMGGAVGWVSLPANLAAMPVVAPITVLGLLAAGLSPLAPAPAAVVASVAAWPAGWIAATAHVTSGLPLAHAPWPEGWMGLTTLAAVTGCAALVWIAIRRVVPSPSPATKAAVAGVVAVALVLAVVLPPDRRGWPPDGWFLIMCDVGQGDALIVRSGDGQAVVIDAGPEPDAVAGCLDDAGIRAVPALVLTHFHADHVRGIAGVFRGRSVGSVLATPVQEPPAEAEAVDAFLATRRVVRGSIGAGDMRTAGDVSWRAIWPGRRISAGSVPNNASVVLVLDVVGRSILLTGDIEPEAQAAIADDLGGRRFDAVKVPHHGSRNQAPAFTRWAMAPIALISVGSDNDYGHPAPETIAAWQGLGAVIARTDRNGDVALVRSGSAVGVVTRGGMLRAS